MGKAVINGPEIGLKKKTLDFMGSCVDAAFLSVPRLIRPFQPVRSILRDDYEKQIDFYFEKGYVDNPLSFYTLSDETPDYSVIEEKPIHGGKYQVISYQSGYTVKNPLIEKRYNAQTNNQTGYIFRWTHGDPNRKTLLCLHGYMLGEPEQARKMFKIDRLFEKGLDVVLFIAPFHWRRAPAEKSKRGIFLQSNDVVMTCEAMGQTLYDLYRTLNILEDMGIKKPGIIGASLGGYIASILSCLTDRHAFAAMMVPAVNFSKPFGTSFAKHGFDVNEALMNKINQVWELHSPLHLMPKLPVEKMLFVSSRGDKVCPFEFVLELCKKWNWPQFRFMTGGHWLVFSKNARGRAWYGFLSEMGFIDSKD